MKKCSMFGFLCMVAVAAGVLHIASTAGADLVRYYALNETSGSVAVDSTGNQNGTFVNGPTLGAASRDAGLYGTAVEFTKTNDYVDLGSGLGQLTDNITVAAWIKPNSVPASGSGFCWIVCDSVWSPDPSIGWGFGIRPDNNGPQLDFSVPGVYSYRTPFGVWGTDNVGEWAHVAVTFNTAEGARFYVNGVQFGDMIDYSGTPITASTNSYNINYWEGDHWQIGMDEVRIYNNVLADGEIAALANRMIGDANHDFVVDEDDAAALAAHWLQETNVVEWAWESGDFNLDGMVDDLDATLLAANWGSSTSAAVPEPSTFVVLLGLFIAGWLSYRFSRS